MKRLGEEGADKVSSLIKKLELEIVHNTLTQKKLEQFQNTLDRIDDESDEPNFRLYELQSIIHYVQDDKTKALEFIEDALSLENNVKEYSKTGALLAELSLEKSGETEFLLTDSPVENNWANTRLDEEKEREALRKKYSGKLEGWLALYTLRIIVVPIILLYDILTTYGSFEDSGGTIVEGYLLAAMIAETIATLGIIFVWFSYFKKKRDTLLYASLFEGYYGAIQIVFGFWLYQIYSELNITIDGDVTKLFTYGVVAILWFIYWRMSKRAKATFIN